MLSWTDSYNKTQRLSKNSNSDVLVQLKQDWNTGYHMFNQKLARYYSRKQQFTNLIAGQQIYQTPLDCVRVMGMTSLVTPTYMPPISEVRSEFQWRQITSYPMQSNWPGFYFMIGNDELALWPVPSQNITNGLRFYYQPQDHDLSIDDFATSSPWSQATITTSTVTVSDGSTTVLASSGIFNTGMIGLNFQLLGVPDLSWYEIVAVPTTSTLTLKSAFVGVTGNNLGFRIAQISIIPQEYQDAPMHWALMNYFSAEGNETRSNFHSTQYQNMVVQCTEDYSSSNESSVITDDEEYLNIWAVPPPASAM